MRSTKNGQGGGGGGASTGLQLLPSASAPAPPAAGLILWLDGSGRIHGLDSLGEDALGFNGGNAALFDFNAGLIQLSLGNYNLTMVQSSLLIQHGATAVAMSDAGVVLTAGAGRNLFLGGLRTTSPGVTGALWRDPVTGLVHIDP